MTPEDRRDIVGHLIEAEDEAELAGWLETVHGWRTKMPPI